MTEEVKEFWQNFCQRHQLAADTPVDAWAFGDDPDGLADLVNRGIKTATTSAYELYDQHEELPQVGEWGIILTNAGSPVCVVQERVVELVPYNLISVEHAYHEGDRTYKNWREIHDRFFKQEYEKVGKKFYPQAPMVCEVFAKVD
ncbi:ASCH domain-containing protein [Lactobacillus xylocopicola]|uniref:RNA-binding protein n=1 Tax=Lactobacillus xylocopicola TaxID=2976676 RepID=A0ABN6SNA1_9LACO|nr:ASCH domain-containing protein [Lactobacillus xylocopicola]BDR61199.1 RNA-binding protein [Lactobacillus xylocopicola]